jgi:chromosomal replication initiation ATPase DnaA
MLQDILIKASGLFDVPIKVIIGHSRKRRHCEARFAVVYAARQQRWTLDEIGALLDGRDHSTILHAMERADALARTDAWYAERLAALL